MRARRGGQHAHALPYLLCSHGMHGTHGGKGFYPLIMHMALTLPWLLRAEPAPQGSVCIFVVTVADSGVDPNRDECSAPSSTYGRALPGIVLCCLRL